MDDDKRLLDVNIININTVTSFPLEKYVNYSFFKSKFFGTFEMTLCSFYKFLHR